ncbi:PH domain-containing protein [Amycolatopsis pigmentata]|uniref:PH domain-containing protein n=1 Tax=Amycolatopsis pigmentata TaxID=450801 RepID=A0ABW5FXX7_9PSEU
MTSLPARTETEVAWNRLSPKMLAVHPVQEAIRFLPVLVGVVFIGNDGRGHVWGLAGLALAVAAGLLRWFTTTYQVTPTHVQVRRGLLRRRELSVPRDRIRSVDLTSHPMQRVLGLSRVVIGTGRSDRGDEGVTLDALSTADAARLRRELLYRSTVDAAGIEDVTTPAPAIATLSPSWIRFGPFTLSGIATIGVVVATAADAFRGDRTGLAGFGLLRSLVSGLAAQPVALLLAEVAVGAAIVVAVLSAIAYVLAFWNFRLVRQEGTLHVTRGLLTTRSTTIELRRLRGAEISEPLLLRAVGGARCLAITTGLRVGRGAEHGGSVLLPPAPVAEAERVASEVLSDPAPVTARPRRHGPRARLRRHVRTVAFAALVTGALAGAWLTAAWPAWPWLGALALFPAGVVLAEDRYRNLGHALSGGRLVFRHGSLVRRRYMLAGEGVIGWTFRRTFFQRRAGLATLTATTAAGHQHYSTMDIPVERAVELAEAATPGLLEPFLIRR